MNLGDDASPGGGLAGLLARQKEAFARDMSPDAAVRLDLLARLDRMVERDADRLARAIATDFGSRSEVVTGLTETFAVRSAIRHARSRVTRWMRPRRAPVAWPFRPGRAAVVPQPLGVVGIIAPWNYPLLLLLSPLVGALAAGNRAMLKPSELTPNFAELIKRCVREAFAEEEVAAVTGGPEVGEAFAGLPFDHLVFTGSTKVGRLVAQAAAKNLTPVTLELGGKSPAILDPSADLKRAADRIVWGKLLNAGQTCIAPDYALAPRSLTTPFLDALKAAAARQYPTIAGNPDYVSIVSDRHFERLAGLVADARARGAEIVPLGPEGDAAARLFAPVAVLGATPDMAVMREEIFGPILPVLPYDAPEDALAIVNGGERPLALYWFGEDRGARDRILARTLSGGVTINDTLLHVAQEGLPFGGVGASGYGSYHGRHGFRTFSKEKPVFIQSRCSTGPLLDPPYRGFARRMVSALMRWG